MARAIVAIAIAIANDVSSVVSSVVDVSSIAGNVDNAGNVVSYSYGRRRRRRSTSIAGRFNRPPFNINIKKFPIENE
jgi:hypothetical protein